MIGGEIGPEFPLYREKKTRVEIYRFFNHARGVFRFL